MLNVTDLTVRSGASRLVESLSFSLPDQHVLALYGPSGAGKSTTLHAIAGLIQPPLVAAGSIHLNDVDLGAMAPDERSRSGVAIVLQGLGLFPHMSAAANVAYPLERRGVARGEALGRALATLSRFQLKSFAHRAPHTLSGGQQQRVALARAAICEPRLLLLDEPFKGLEQDLRDELIALVRAMCGDGTSVILVTHEIRELQLAADSVVLLRQGQVVGNATRNEMGTVPFDLPVRRITIPCTSAPDGTIEAARARLLLEDSSKNGERLTTIVINEIRSLGFGHLAVLAQFESGATRWIDVDHRHLSALTVGEKYQLAYQPVSMEVL